MIDINRSEAHTPVATTEAVLVNASLSGNEAQELALSILDATIQFHKLQNLRSGVHHDCADPSSDPCLEQLMAQRSEMIRSFSEAKDSGQRIRLNGALSLQLDNGFTRQGRMARS